MPTVSNAREAVIPSTAFPACTSLIRSVSLCESLDRQSPSILTRSVPCEAFQTAAANGWASEVSPLPSARVSTSGFELGLPALSRLPEPQPAAPLASTMANASHAQRGEGRAFIAACFLLAVPSVAALPGVSHRGLPAIVHLRVRVVPYGNASATCHDSVVSRSWRTEISVRAGAVALGVLGAAFGPLTLAKARSAPGGSLRGTSWTATVTELAAGWALITAGVAESWRRPTSRAGLLLAGAGIGWFFTEWNNPGLGSPAAFTFGLIISALAAPLVAHAALAYPTGRLDSRLDLAAALFAYAGAGLMLGLFPALFFDPGRQ